MDKLLFVGLVCLSFVLHSDAVTRMGNGSHQGEEGRLIRDLLDNGYDVRERPFVQDGGPVLFNLTLHLIAISDLDPRTQVLSGISWFLVDWYDDRLAWDPSDYAGIGSFTVNIDQTWSPKIYLQNTILDQPVNPIQHDVSQTYISYDGKVHLESPLLHHTSCDLDLHKFPFDEQECWLVFTTQNTPIHLVKLGSAAAVVKNPNISAEYNIVGSSTRSEFIVIPGNITYEQMEIGFKLERLSRFYVQNVTSPITFLSWLAIVIFIIPAKSGERLSAAISLVLGLTVFQIVITDNMPKNSRGRTAVVISYVSECFIITIVVAIMSAIVINISHRKGHIHNKLIRVFFFDIIGPWFLVGWGGCGKKKVPGSRPNDSCRDLEMKETQDKVLSTKNGHSRLAWMKTQTSKWTRFEAHPQSEILDQDEDFEVLGQILDRIFMLSIFVTLTVITVKFLMMCEDSLSKGL